MFHADAYSGYNGIYGDKVSEAACWAHFRRKFYEVFMVSKGSATIAKGYRLPQEDVLAVHSLLLEDALLLGEVQI